LRMGREKGGGGVLFNWKGGGEKEERRNTQWGRRRRRGNKKKIRPPRKKKREKTAGFVKLAGREKKGKGDVRPFPRKRGKYNFKRKLLPLCLDSFRNVGGEKASTSYTTGNKKGGGGERTEEKGGKKIGASTNPSNEGHFLVKGREEETLTSKEAKGREIYAFLA